MRSYRTAIADGVDVCAHRLHLSRTHISAHPVLTPALQSIQPQLVADPEFYAAHKLFGGHWATPSGAAPDLESRKDALLDFYVNEVEQRRWYGFWDYGELGWSILLSSFLLYQNA